MEKRLNVVMEKRLKVVMEEMLGSHGFFIVSSIF